MTDRGIDLPTSPSLSAYELTRRGFLGLGVASGAALALAACGVGGSSSSGTKGSGKGSINALFMKQAGYSEDDITKMTAEFTAANPDIKVTPTFVAYEALHDKIVAAAAAGTYDVVLIDVIWPAEFGSKKIVADVTSRFSDEWKQKMLGGALTTAKYQDKFFGAPWILDTKYFYYNDKHMQRAGVDPASLDTWEGVAAAAKKIKAAGVSQYPLVWSWQQAEAIICDYTQLLGAFGGKFLDDSGQPAFHTGGGLDALTFMKQTLDDKITNPNSLQSLEDGVVKVMGAGQASMALNWTFMYNGANEAGKAKEAGNIKIMPTPKGSAGNPGVNGSMALCVSSGSKNQDAAWKYIDFLVSAKEQEKYAKSSLPVWKDSYDKPAVVSTLPAVVPVAKVELNNMIERPQVAAYTKMSTALQVELQNALLGKKTPEKALADAAEAAKALLK